MTARAATDRISATDITGCLRGLVYKKRGTAAPPLHPDILRTLELFRTFGETGQAIQQKLTAFWRAKGCLVDGGDFIPSDAGFTGRYDTICQIRGKLVLYEIKGVSQHFFAWVKEHREPRPYNVIQLMLYHKALLPRYPDIEPRLLYASRVLFKQGKLAGVEIPVSYSEQQYGRALADASSVRDALAGGQLPAAWPAIEHDPQTGKPDIAMNALTCRHHALCLDDEQWYAKAKRELGADVDDIAAEAADRPVDEENVPFS